MQLHTVAPQPRIMQEYSTGSHSMLLRLLKAKPVFQADQTWGHRDWEKLPGLRGLELHRNEGKVPRKTSRNRKSWNCGVQLGRWTITRWWFQVFFMFNPVLGKIRILTNIFQGVGSTTNKIRIICLKFPLRMNWLLRIHFKAPVEKTKRFLFLGGCMYDCMTIYVVWSFLSLTILFESYNHRNRSYPS